MGLAAKQGGLQGRRVIEEFINGPYANLQQKIWDAVGFEVKMDVDWDSFYHQTADTSYWAGNFEKVYFEPMIEGLSTVCRDDMGKQAFKDKINTIKFVNTDNRYHGCCSLDGDTFVFDHGPDSNVDYGNERTKEIVSFLETNL